MKKTSFIIFILFMLVLVGAGCFNTPPASTPAPAANTNIMEINVSAPVNENNRAANVVDSLPSPEEPSASATVSIQNFSFNLPSVIIVVGGEVTWSNQDSTSHTVTGEDWGSELLEKGQSFTKKFETPGVYPYHCTVHPDMTGRVVVR